MSIPEIKTSRGTVWGAKTYPFSTENNGIYDILLHVLIMTSGGEYVCTCLNLQIDGYGKTPEEAENDMKDSVRYFINQNFEKLSNDDAWRNIFELQLTDETTREYWNAFFEVFNAGQVSIIKD